MAERVNIFSQVIIFFITLTLNMVGKISADDILKYLPYVYQKTEFDNSWKLSPFAWHVESYFLGENKKNIVNL